MSRMDHDILLIDDDPRHAKAFEGALSAASDGLSRFEWVRTLSSGLERLAHKGVWAIFLNLFLPDSRGLHTIDKLLSVTSTAPIVVLGGVDDEDIIPGGRRVVDKNHLQVIAAGRPALACAISSAT